MSTNSVLARSSPGFVPSVKPAARTGESVGNGWNTAVSCVRDSAVSGGRDVCLSCHTSPRVEVRGNSEERMVLRGSLVAWSELAWNRVADMPLKSRHSGVYWMHKKATTSRRTCSNSDPSNEPFIAMLSKVGCSGPKLSRFRWSAGHACRCVTGFLLTQYGGPRSPQPHPLP